jgi:hypothetical protein
MSSANTVIKFQTRYTINGVAFNAIGGDVTYTRDATIVSDSEDMGGRRRKPGEYEAEIMVRGNLATDVSPHIVPFGIAEGNLLATVAIYFQGIGNAPDLFTFVLIDRFRKVSEGDMSQANTFEFHGYTCTYQKAGT